MFFGAFQKQFFNQRSTLIIWIALVLLLSSISKAERLPIKTYTVADGLLRDNVFKIKQDSRGFMWFCTVEGISRFDGYAFENFTTDDGLPDRHVNDFLETRTGEIFVATDGGLARLNPTGVHASKENPLFKVYPQPDNPLAKAINVLFEDESATIFIGTRNGLYKLNAQGEVEAVYIGESLDIGFKIEHCHHQRPARRDVDWHVERRFTSFAARRTNRTIYNCERIVEQ